MGSTIIMATSYPVGKAPWETGTNNAPASFPVGKAPWELPQESTTLEQSKPNYFQRVGETYKRSGEDIVGAVKKGAQEMSSPQRFLQPQISMARVGLETVGSVARSAIAPILEVPVVKQALGLVGKGIEKIPGAGEVIRGANELAQKHPQGARDLQNIIDIATLGYAPKGGSALLKEGKAVSSDVSQGVKIALTPSEQAVQSKVLSLFQKSIKPTSKKTLAQGQKYENDVLNALKTIKNNADDLNIEDAVGELVTGRTPKTISELAQGVDQTKKLVFEQYNALAEKAGSTGVIIDAKPIALEISKVSENKALQLTNPEIIKYAQQWSDRLNAFGNLDPQTTQEVIKLMNNNLQAFYKNPTYDAASRVAVDAGIANNFRGALDAAIEGATGSQYQTLKNQYGALKAIENDVVRASMRDARKNVKGLLDYSDIFTGGQMIGGILSLNPAMFTKGAVERGFKEYFKFLNDPNRAVGNIFDKLNTNVAPEFNPSSILGKKIKR